MRLNVTKLLEQMKVNKMLAKERKEGKEKPVGQGIKTSKNCSCLPMRTTFLITESKI